MRVQLSRDLFHTQRLTIAVEYKLKFTPEKADQIPALQERVAGRVYDLTSSGGHYINKGTSHPLHSLSATHVSEPRLADRVYIPHIFPELSTKKITTAEWIDGVRLSDKHGISLLMGDDRASASSTDPLPADRFPLLRGGAKWVMQTMINLFSAQIFDWGWVHCDPHPGNVIVRPHSDPRRAAHGAAQLVLLDHGLYVRLPREFQQQYARLWKALLTVDFAAVSAVAGEWGIGAPDLFASATLMRPIRFAEQAPLPDFERMNDYERWVVMKAKQADVDRNIFCLQR